MDWLADNRATRDPSLDVTSSIALMYDICDLFGVNARHEIRELVHEWLRARAFFFVVRRVRMNQVETEPAEVELAYEALMLPLGFTRRFGDIARFLLGGEPFLLGHFRLRKRIVPIIEMAAKENH